MRAKLRGALRVLVAGLAVSWTASSCGARPTAPEAVAGAAIAIEAMDAEVWAFERRVEGTADPACREVEVVREGGPRIDAARTQRRFVAEVPLVSGANVIVARCVMASGRVITSAPLRLEVRIQARPRARVEGRVAGDAIVLDLGASEPAEARPAELVEGTWRVLRGREPIAAAQGMRVEVRAPGEDGEYVVEGRVVDAMGREDRAALRLVVEEGRARVVDPMREQARWIDRAVVYGAVPFLFGTPGLPAITARLDALCALGVDTIWLSPITDSPDDDYGYAVTDYFEVRPVYGTREDVRALVDAAHARGMRVVMDFVPNHTSDQHPYFQHVRRHGRRSPYWAFYDHDERGRVTHYFDWENLPNLDYDNPEVRRWMREAFSFWARELDMDGFRVDAAWGVEQRAPAFFRALAEELYRIDPQLLLIAEASARDPYWREVGFAAAYDWTEEIGRWAWRDAMGAAGDDPGIDVPALRAAIVATERATEGGPRVVRFLDNNDTGARFLTRQGRGAHDAASALLMTLPGIPALFTGAEIGAEYQPYERQEPLDWRAADGVGRALAARIAVRREVPVLTEGELVMLEVDPEDAVLAFLRRDPDGEHAPALVVIELGGEAVRATIELPADAQRAMGTRASWRDALAGEGVSVERRAGRVEVPLEAYGARVLEGAL